MYEPLTISQRVVLAAVICAGGIRERRGRLVINNAMTVNGAFEAPSPNEWLVLDPDSNNVSLEQFLVADAMVLGRKTYEGLAAVWPHLVDDPTLGIFAERLNSMPKYVASRTLQAPLAWHATLLEGDLADSVTALKDRHERTLIVSGAGELAHTLVSEGLVDEFWFWVSPYLWASGPRIFDGIGLHLELIGATTFASGVVRLAYRPAPAEEDGESG
jgi:dihydrofolate reductase